MLFVKVVEIGLLIFVLCIFGLPSLGTDASLDLLVRAAEKSDQSSPKHFVLHRQKTHTVTMERELWHRLLLIQPSIHLVRELGENPGSYIDNGIMSNRVPCYIALAA